MDFKDFLQHYIDNKFESSFEEQVFSIEEKYECDPFSFFPNCPEDAKTSVERLIKLRSTDTQFFSIGGWETIKGIDNSTPKHHYKGLVESQIRREDRAYISYMVHELRR